MTKPRLKAARDRAKKRFAADKAAREARAKLAEDQDKGLVPRDPRDRAIRLALHPRRPDG